MARPHPLNELMATPLPSVSVQKLKPYRPAESDVIKTYNLINRSVFENKLSRPPLKLGTCRGYWGMCLGHQNLTRPGTWCEIKLMDKYFCVQWFVNTLAHEMVHQYEWDILDKNMTHRQSFFIWREELAKYNIHLKTAHRMTRWFKYQNFNKC